MDRKFLEFYAMKMEHKRRWLFGAFVLNLVCIAIVWLLTFVPGFIWLGSIVTGFSFKMMYVAIIGALGLWGVFSLVFFLVPALAMWRQLR